MPVISLTLILSSFFAGILTFLAPCTLPMIPAYIAFISGVSEAQAKNQVAISKAHAHILMNAFAFVCGFSFVFISFGLLAGTFGSFIGSYKVIFGQVGGLFIIFFGLLMLNILSFSPFSGMQNLPFLKGVVPGKKLSAFLMGSIFALGWTPCIGPILATVLLFASMSATAVYGAFLLSIFSLGLAIPFLVTAFLYSKMSRAIESYAYIAKYVTVLGGICMIVIGFLMFSNQFELLLQYGSVAFSFFHLQILTTFY